MIPDGEPSAHRLALLIGAYKSPHVLYDEVRDRSAVHFDSVSKCWIATGHSAIRTVLSDARFSSELVGSSSIPPPGEMSFLKAAIERQIVFSDDERHRRVQQVILRESARTMHQAEPVMRALAERLVNEARCKGSFDLVRDFALPYTMDAISQMVGVPVDDPLALRNLAQWSTTFANVTSGYLQVRLREIGLLGDYFRALVKQSDPPAGGLIAAFRAENIFADDEDLLINCLMVFGAGRVTTQKVLCDGVSLLMGSWDEWRRAINKDPGLVRHLTEELLRLVTPTRYVARRAVEDVTLDEVSGGGTIRKGEKIILFLEAGNRDPKTFPSPHMLIAERKPNAQIAFGHGPHRCPGASMARIEIQIALQAMVSTFADLRADSTAAPVWDSNPNIGGFVSFPCLCM